MEGLPAEVRPLRGLSNQRLMGGTSVETKEKPSVQPGLSPEGGQLGALPGGWSLCLPGWGGKGRWWQFRCFSWAAVGTWPWRRVSSEQPPASTMEMVHV